MSQLLGYYIGLVLGYVAFYLTYECPTCKVSKMKKIEYHFRRCKLCNQRPHVKKEEDGTWTVRCGSEFGPPGCGLTLYGQDSETKQSLIERWNKL